MGERERGAFGCCVIVLVSPAQRGESPQEECSVSRKRRQAACEAGSYPLLDGSAHHHFDGRGGVPRMGIPGICCHLLSVRGKGNTRAFEYDKCYDGIKRAECELDASASPELPLLPCWVCWALTCAALIALTIKPCSKVDSPSSALPSTGSFL